MRIAIAGGTGFVGRHIAQALIGSDHEVHVLGRDRTKVGSIPQLKGARPIEADVTNASSLAGTLDGIEAVVGVVQFPNYPVEMPRKGLTFDRYDRIGTENLLTEATRAGVSRYVYLSGVGADVTSDKPWYRAKGLAEHAVRNSGLEWAIVRPSWAYGPEDKALNRFAQIARFSPVVPRIGVRTQVVQPIYVGDVARCVRRIFDVDKAWGNIFEIGGPVMSMHDVIATMLDVSGRKRAIVPIPAPLAKIGTVPLLLLPKPFMSPGGIEFAVQNAVVHGTAAKDILGLEPLELVAGLSRYMNG